MRALSDVDFYRTNTQFRIRLPHNVRAPLLLRPQHLKKKKIQLNFFWSLCKTDLPFLIVETILLSPLLVDEGRAIIGLPLPSKPSAAPLRKSTWPPKPEYILVPIESDTIWPVKSTSMQELIAVIFGFFAITPTKIHVKFEDVYENNGEMLTGVIYIIDNQHFNERIVVNKIVQLLGTDQKRSNNSALVNYFPVICNAASVN